MSRVVTCSCRNCTPEGLSVRVSVDNDVPVSLHDQLEANVGGIQLLVSGQLLIE